MLVLYLPRLHCENGILGEITLLPSVARASNPFFAQKRAGRVDLTRDVLLRPNKYAPYHARLTKIIKMEYKWLLEWLLVI